MLAVGRAFPPHRYTQEELVEALRATWSSRLYNLERLEQVHRNAMVATRHLALSVPDYRALGSFTDANDAYLRVGAALGEAAVEDALARAGLAPADVDALWFVTSTGISVPSLDALLCNRLGLRRDVRRAPLFGLGCVAGAAGLARAAEAVTPHPHGIALVLSVELCSLTLQRDDLSMANLVASGLFGDGAACAVLGGAARFTPGRPRVLATRSVLHPGTEHVMGFRVGADGFRLVLTAEVPHLVRRHLRADLDAFLGEHGLGVDDVAVWVVHPGGPKILRAVEEVLELAPGAVDRTWRSLRDVGNLSSASVLVVLGDALSGPPPPPGSFGVALGMGPGFGAEALLLGW